MPSDTLSRFQPVSMTLAQTDKARFAAELGKSFREFGFAAIADHGLDNALITDAYDKAAEFFALPESKKMAYLVEGGGGARGYTPFGQEQAKDAEGA